MLFLHFAYVNVQVWLMLTNMRRSYGVVRKPVFVNGLMKIIRIYKFAT